nr:RNA-directed DNA polymerase, eukaryota, reverse transcriptase zinc-binding domain protein [Tanacetum cinerariifolium]
MMRLETFRLKSMWGNYKFDFARSMARGRSRGMISMWDLNSFIKDDIWCGDAFIIVMRQWRNTVDNYGLIDLPLGDRIFTWMNKARTKISKLDRFLISEEVVEALPDVRVTDIDRLWSDHNPILLHVFKSDFGPTPFKLFHSWLLRDSFDKVIKAELSKLEEHNFGKKLLSHEKFRLLEARIKQWHSKIKTSDRVTKYDNLQLIKSTEEKIKAGFANNDDHDSRIKLLQEVDIKVGISEYVNIFLDTGSLPHGSSSSFFTLILKVSNPIFIKDFRPMSLIGVYYKIIAKVLANRLAKVIDNIVSHEQSTFIAGYQIINGPLILSLLLSAGLKINIKSNVYGIGVLDVDVSSMASNSRCASGSFPFTYLGLPIGFIMSLTSSWQVLLGRLQSKLSSWKANLLSIGDRYTLKSILRRLSIYYFLIFKVPESFLNSLERSRAIFFGEVLTKL